MRIRIEESRLQPGYNVIQYLAGAGLLTMAMVKRASTLKFFR